MSGWQGCTCEGTRKQKMKNWYVVMRNYNLSHFERPKGCRHYSDYSTVMCKGEGCSMVIRTKAGYVKSLPDGQREEAS